MAETKIPKTKLGPLAIDDDDVAGISLEKLNQSGATNNQVPQWNSDDSEWQASSLVAGSTFVDSEELAGTKNNINKEFTIAYLPAPPISMQLFQGGVLLRQGVGHDYTIDNQTITFAIAPGPNDALLVFYRR